MNADHKQALAEYLLAMGDDEFILGHRNSEWCGHAPILEEDIAFANLALDEIGHASQWYSLVAELREEDPGPYTDRLIYFRPAGEYRNIQMVELPNGDWAFSLLRQYLFDTAESIHLEMLASSAFTPLANTAAKIRKEETYHLRHSRAWIQRLGLGTEESHRRLQNGLNALWPYTGQFFMPLPGAAALVEAGFIPAQEALEMAWEEPVAKVLHESGLSFPTEPKLRERRDQHTPHLAVLLAEMQSVARLDPEAGW